MDQKTGLLIYVFALKSLSDKKGNAKFPVIFILIVLFVGCSKSNRDENLYPDRPVCTGSFLPKPYDKQVVGFYPAWNSGVLPINDIQWDKLTRIVYAFAVPNNNGTINTEELQSTHKLVETAHAHGVEVYFSIGGADGSVNFPSMALKENSRKRFIKEVKRYLFENCLDGVDIDWEYWSGYADNTVIPAESNALVTLLKLLKMELSPFHIGISADVGATDWTGKHFYNEVPDYVDHIMVMCYDFTGTWTDPGPHSSLTDAIGSDNTKYSTGIAYWVKYKLWPGKKILFGVPFYGKDFDVGGGSYISYASILMLYPDAWMNDRIENIYYDGIGTMKAKAQYVTDNNLSGIMIWEITQDTKTDSLSLLNAINTVLYP